MMAYDIMYWIVGSNRISKSLSYYALLSHINLWLVFWQRCDF